jgi:hypothetical protein
LTRRNFSEASTASRALFTASKAAATTLSKTGMDLLAATLDGGTAVLRARDAADLRASMRGACA